MNSDSEKQDNSAAPIFLCGPLRSGTTVLGLMLAYHPCINAPGEYDFIFDYLYKDNGEKTSNEEFSRLLKLDRVYNQSGLHFSKDEEPAVTVRGFIDQLTIESKINVINLHRHFYRVPEIIPDARFIHILRDPRDVARSAIGMGWAGNVYHGLEFWEKSECDWQELESTLRSEQYIQVRFEDIITDTREVLTEICRFLGLEYNDQMLDYPQYTTYDLPDPSLVYQWKRKQTRKEVQLLEYRLGRELEKMGYENSGYPPYIPNNFELLYLDVQNRIFKYKFRIRRYGLRLFVFEFLSRKLGLNAWNERLIKKINEVDMHYLK